MLNEIKTDKNELIQIASSISVSIKDLSILAKQNNVESLFYDKVKLATSKLKVSKFSEFWMNFIFLLKGEITSKTVVKDYINGLDPKMPSKTDKLNGDVIVLSSLFINYRHQLIEELYDFIVDYYKNSLKTKTIPEIDIEIDNLLKNIFLSLKATLNTNSGLVLQIIEDIQSSLLSAQDLGKNL